MSTTRHVIIGNSGAGLNAATAIRQADPTAEITMLSAEGCMAYSPVVLPYLVAGEVTEQGMYITDRDFYKKNDIDLKLGTKAEGIDAISRKVFVENGSHLEYDRLLIATGASPRRLALDISQVQDRVFSLRTMADARSIFSASRGISHVLIVGAGLVGLETAYAFWKKGVEVAIMAKSQQILSRNSDAQCARMIQKRIEEKGITFFFGRDIVAASKENGRIRVKTDVGDEFLTDMIVVGKGVSANLSIVRDTGITTEWGIQVDLSMQTNVPGIYAAGDVAQSRHLLNGNTDTFSNWPSACLQGKIAGSNMAGNPVKLAGEVAYNVMPVFEMAAAFMERRDDGDRHTEVFRHVDEERGVYRKILVKKDRVVGGVMLGAYRDAGVMLHLLKKRTNVSHLKEGFATGRAVWGGKQLWREGLGKK